MAARDYSASAEFARARREGITLPKEPVQARMESRRLAGMSRESGSFLDTMQSYERRLGQSEGRSRLNSFQVPHGIDQNDSIVKDMGMRRSGMRKQGAAFGTDAQWAWPKIHDPFEYWRERTWWYNMEDPEEQEQKIRDWCTPGDSPIWMGDYSFKNIEKVQVGDEVLGFEVVPAKTQRRRKLVKTKVKAIQSRMSPEIVEITMASGRVLKCTPDHKWANHHHVDGYVTAQVGSTLKHVIDSVLPLSLEQEFASGYIAGMFDGEGNVFGNTFEINQSMSKNPHICERITKELDILGLKYKVLVEERERENDVMCRWTIKGEHKGHGTRQEVVNFYNWTHPAKMTQEWMDKTILTTNFSTEDRVVSIKSLGPGEVWSMETETGNYINQGYASKNCRLMYTTHYLVPSCIDIYTRFPLLDVELVHPDRRLVQFYEELFFDSLNYEEFLFTMGREYWTVGEVFALGSWHDGIGAWDGDEIINPNDVIVAKNRALRSYSFHVKVPEEIKKLIDTREPYAEYQALVQLYPDVISWAREDTEIPVSDVLMKQLKFQVNPWSEHGTPILMRAFRTLMLEESLNAAQDAIADRLYSPLILATLGLPDVDQDGPWIPDAAELQALRDDLAMTINADFRLMVYHHGLDIKNAFGRETMPRLDQDFIRQETKLLQVFGISPELLQGGKTGVAYSSSALNRELITQMLSTYQVYQKNFIKERMEAVAERQGHYEYRRVGTQRIPVMENVLVVDEETGEEYVEERPKLAIPEVKFRAMNLRDEATERAFMQQLSMAGFPVSLSTMAVNIPIDFDEEGNARMDEKIKSVVWEQQMKSNLWQRLRAQNLPIPLEMMEEYQSYLETQENPEMLDEIEPQVIADISSLPPTPNISGPGPQQDASQGQSGEGEAPGGAQTPPELSLPGQESPASGPSTPQTGMPQQASKRLARKREAMSVPEEGESIIGMNYDELPQDLAPMYEKYSNKKAFGTPREFTKRVKQKLPKGIRISTNESIDHYDESEFQSQLDQQRKFMASREKSDDGNDTGQEPTLQLLKAEEDDSEEDGT